MNSIEWLKEKYINQNCSLTIIDFDKAKQLHKQEIIDAYCNGNDLIGVEQYYQETFVSKGSDEVELPQQEISDEEIEKAAERLQKDKYGIFISKEADVKGQLVIDTAKAAFLSGMIEGAKWYREQLLKKN